MYLKIANILHNSGFTEDYSAKTINIFVLQVGITCSYGLWSVSATFLTFILSRVVGGISKGNLSCSMAAMTDVSSTDKRASGMVVSLYYLFVPRMQSDVFYFTFRL